MNYPKSWADITIKQYQLISLIKEADPIERSIAIICYLTGKKENELMLNEIGSFSNQFDFIMTEPKGRVESEIILDGQIFTVCFMSNMLCAGQYIDLTELCKENVINNIDSLMAVLCVKKGEKYQGYLKYKDLFRDKCTMDKVFPLTSFFLKSSEKLLQIIKTSLQKKSKKMLKELMKEMEREIGSTHSMPLVEAS